MIIQPSLWVSKHFLKAYSQVFSNLTHFLISKDIQFIESKPLTDMCVAKIYVEEAGKSLQNTDFFLMGKNGIYKINFWVFFLLHSFESRVAQFVYWMDFSYSWYLCMTLKDVYQLTTELPLVFRITVKILEELKLVFSMTIPHSLCFSLFILTDHYLDFPFGNWGYFSVEFNC